MIEFNRLCRIMIKDMKTRISKLNIDFDYEAYWEIIYLILLAFFVGMRFLLSTMFTIYWPKYFYRTLTVIGVVLVLLHLMMAKDISKKEIAAMLVVTFVFMMSHYVSGYDFLVDLLILILGAYRVNFRNILKTYIAVWSVLLVVTIIGAMTGLAENLVYYQWQHGEGQRARMALGICYPTDLAAYVAFLMLTYIGFRGFEILKIELVVMLILTIVVYYITDARTDVACMIVALLIVCCLKLYLKKHKIDITNPIIKRIIIAIPFIVCAGMLLATVLFSNDSEVWNAIDTKLNSRLMFSKQALEDYGITLNGQYIFEKGAGGTTDSQEYYFFIDSSYISIIIKYGVILLVLLCGMLSYSIHKFEKTKEWGLIVALFVICIHSIMEHHLIQYWYNPFIIAVFSACNIDKLRINKNPRRGKVELKVEKLG